MLAKYDKVELIGSGTFGNVYLVRSKASGTSYVLKEVLLTSMSPTERNQALTEVTVLARCRHKNIIRYKEAMVEEERGMLCIVMEHAEHGDMYAAIKRQQGVYFPETDVLSWFVQITLALQYIHNQNILHRDLKTQNIFLGVNKLVKIGDFGIARVLKTEKELATTAIGTPYYLSPEICQRQPYNCKSDIWALGCVLYEIATLKHPFQGQNFHQLVIAILNVDCKELPSHCSPLIQDLVKILLAADPVKRPSTNEILTIPLLQAHIERYFSIYSPTSCMTSFDSLPTPKIKHAARRFSSDDVLCDNSKVPLKRRSSATSPNQGKAIWQQLTYKTPVVQKKSRIFTSARHKQATASYRSPGSGNEVEESLACRRNSRSVSPTTDFLELPHKVSPSKSYKARTYTLWKKAIEKGEQLIGKSPSKKKGHQLTSGIDSDNGYHTIETSQQEAATQEHGVGSGARRKSIHKSSKKSVKATESLSASPNIGASNCDDVFDSAGGPPVIDGASLSDALKCPHNSRCSHCILDTLWRNRIRRVGDVDETQRIRLKKKLEAIFGKERFDDIYTVLTAEWVDSSLDENFSSSELLSLNFDEREFFPLLIQLIQLDLINKTSVRF